MKKSLSLPALVTFGIGTIIGAGIYSVTGAAYGHAKETIWISFILAAIASLCTAFSYCELATMIPTAGAEYDYVRRAFKKSSLISFSLAVILIFSGCAITSTVAIAFAGYLSAFFSINEQSVAVCLMIACTIINNLGIENSNRVNVIFTLIELGGMFVIIWFGFTTDHYLSSPSFKYHSGTFTATSLIFFIYLGFEEIVHFAEEARNPSVDVPKAIFISLLLTTVFYFLVSISLIHLARPEAIFKSHSPLADALEGVAPKMKPVLTCIALFSTSNTVLVSMLVISRLIFSISRQGDLPSILGKVDRKFQVPRNSSIVVLIISILFIFFKDLEILASFSSFATLLAFLIVNITVIKMRFAAPDIYRPYKIPLNLKNIPVIPFFGILIVLFMCFQFEKIIYSVSLSFIGLCMLTYYLIRKYKSQFLS